MKATNGVKSEKSPSMIFSLRVLEIESASEITSVRTQQFAAINKSLSDENDLCINSKFIKQHFA